MAPNPKEQEDQVPIIINDSLEDDALSWDNTPITGKWHIYKSLKITFNIDILSVLLSDSYAIFIYTRSLLEPSRLRRLFLLTQTDQIPSLIESGSSNKKPESPSSSSNSSLSSLEYPYINTENVENSDIFEAYESLGITSDDFEGKLKLY